LHVQRVPFDRHHDLGARPLVAHQRRVLVLQRGDALVLLGELVVAVLEVRHGLGVVLDDGIPLAPGHDRCEHDDDGNTHHLSFCVDPTGSEWRIPGRSMNSRTIWPSTTCWATTRSTRVLSIRLYKAVAPRGPGSVAKPVPSERSSATSSRTSTLGPWVHRP